MFECLKSGEGGGDESKDMAHVSGVGPGTAALGNGAL
jgi:hypothetical protein